MSKWLLIFLTCCLLIQPLQAFNVASTYPPAGSESFNVAADTLMITFENGSPDPATASSGIIIQGENASYPIASAIADGYNLKLVIGRRILVGDKITVTVTSNMRSTGGSPCDPFSFRFTPHVPNGQMTGWNTRFDLNFPSQGTPTAIAAADFDGDYPVDLAVLFDEWIVAVRNRLMEVPYNTNPYDANNPDWVASIDFGVSNQILKTYDLDNDDLPDLVFTNYFANTLTIYWNGSYPGNIAFTGPTVYILDGFLPEDFEMLDLNGDAFPEIVVFFWGDDPYQILRNNGDRTFNITPLVGGGTGTNRMMDIADFDLDGKLDFAACYKGEPRVDVFYNNGNYTFQTVSILLDSINHPYNPDGIIVDNVWNFWDYDQGLQYPDILLWSAYEIGNEGYFCRIKNNQLSSPRSFSDITYDDINYLPHSMVLADLESDQRYPDHNWIVSRDDMIEADNDNTVLSTLTTNITKPQEMVSFDYDFDGDIDLCALEWISPNGLAVLFQNPDFIYPEIIYDSLEFDPPNISLPWNPSGVTPIDTSDMQSYIFVNEFIYPIEVYELELESDIFVSLFSSPVYPIILQPGEQLNYPILFTPQDILTYLETAYLTFDLGNTIDPYVVALTLQGTGGRSIIGVDPDILDFGTVTAYTTVSQTFTTENYLGNYVLDARYEPGNTMPHFELEGALQDSVAPYGESPIREISFTAPYVPNAVTFLESLMVWDSRFYNDDILGYPRHITTADTVWLFLKAEVHGPDLKANSITFDPPDPPGVGQGESLNWVRLEVIENNGVDFMDSLNITLTQHRPNFSPDTTLYELTLDSLPTDQPHIAYVNYVPMYPAGNHTFTLTVTPLGEPDYEPENNVLSEEYNVRDSDLKAESIEFVPPYPSGIGQDDKLTINFVVIENLDVAFMDFFNVTLNLYYPDDTNETLSNQTFYTLGAGQSLPLQVTNVSMFPAGDHRFTLTVTPLAQPDANPSNDELSEDYHVLAPDLEAQSLTATSYSIRKGEEITVFFQWGEVGNARVRNPYQVSVTGINWMQEFDSLDRGAFDKDSTTWSSDQAGTFTFQLNVDPRTNPDENDNNNIITMQVDVLYQPIFVHPLPFTPNQDSYNDTLYFDFGDDAFVNPKANVFTLDGRHVISLTQVENKAIVWMGKDKSGNLCLPGAYLFTFEDQGRKVTSGLIYVAR